MDENEPWSVYENHQSRFTFNTIANCLGVGASQKPGQGGGVVMHDEPFAAFYSGGGSQNGFSTDGSVAPTLTVGSSTGGVSPAIASGGGTRTIVRRLTPLKCERLMGWPDNYTAHGITDDGETVDIANTNRYRICGNGIVATVTQWIGRRLP